MSTRSEREGQGLGAGMGVYTGYRLRIRGQRETARDAACGVRAGAPGCAQADPPVKRQVRGRAPCAQAPARVGVRRGGLRVRGGSAALDVRGPRRHGIVDPSSPSVCRRRRCSHQPGYGQLAPRSPGPPCHVGISGYDMLGPDQQIPSLDPCLPQLVASGHAGGRPRGRSRHRQSGILGVAWFLVALVAPAAQDVHSASFWTQDFGLLS